MSEWRSDKPPEDGSHVDVRVVWTYRYKLYKPDGRRQMKARGRWQRIRSEYGGWENCAPPEGCEWKPNEPVKARGEPNG